MLFQETYQAYGNPSKMNISCVRYSFVAEASSCESSESDNKRHYLTPFPFHCHSFYELTYNIEGSSMNVSPKHHALTQTGGITFYPPLTMHSITESQLKENLILQFSPRIVQHLFCNTFSNACLIPSGEFEENGCIHAEPGSELQGILEELASISPVITLVEGNASDESILAYSIQDEIRITAQVLKLLSYLISNGLLEVIDSKALVENGTKMHALMSRIISSPERHMTMEEAAEFVNMSYSNFCRTFKENVGINYIDFCNQIRVQKAQELLLTTKLSITEISAALNFGTFSYFNRIFKKYTGHTPTYYRTSRKPI